VKYTEIKFNSEQHKTVQLDVIIRKY